MIWRPFVQLLPVYLVYFSIAIVLIGICHFVISQVYKNIRFNIGVSIVLALTLTLFVLLNTMVNIYLQQNWVQEAKTPMADRGSPTSSQPPADSLLQAKAEFLNQVTLVLDNPEKYTDEFKKQLFQKYAMLFKKPQDRELFYGNLKRIFECEKVFFDDAMSSYKFKKVLRSDEQKKCAETSGEFFNREKLFPPDVAVSYNTAIEVLGGEKQAPKEIDNYVDKTVTNIKANLDKYDRKMEVLKKLFF